MSTSSPTFGLVCSGGGAHGAYQVGVLDYIHEHFSDGDTSPFRVFCGTSAGSLSTCFYASRSYDARLARHELAELWRGFRLPMPRQSALGHVLKTLGLVRLRASRRNGTMWSLVDNHPLVRIVERGFDVSAFARAKEAGTTLGLAVSATELRSSRLVWFCDGPAVTPWQTVAAIAQSTNIAPHHIVASCSMPFAFPPIKIGHHLYLDGEVSNKAPFGPAISMGATRVLSVATDRPPPDRLPVYPPGFKPGLLDVVNTIAGQLRHDYATDQAMYIDLINHFCEASGSDGAGPIGRIIGDRQFYPEHYRPVEIKLFAPSRRIGHDKVYDEPGFRPDLKRTSLLFDEGFVEELIRLGRDDASSRHDELAEFFDRGRAQRPSRFGPTPGEA